MKNFFATRDDISANFAEVFVTLNGNRYSMCMAKSVEIKANVKTREVYKLGTPVVGHKPETVMYSGTMTITKCTTIFDEVVADFIDTGVMPTFEIQVATEDPAASVGRDSKIFTECVIDGDVLLSAAKAEGGAVEQEISFYAGGVSTASAYSVPSYM